jgi:hypothetical protein
LKTLVRAALFAVTTAIAATAQHFSLAYIDVRLPTPDSIRITVEVDALDFKNSVHTFPTYNDPPGSGWTSFRLYEQRIEAYLQQKVKLRADGKPVNLAVVAWKPGGTSRDDRLDTISMAADNHAITLGGRLPPETKAVSFWSELWNERPDVDPGSPPAMVYQLFEGDAALHRVWTRTERWVRIPVEPDSLALMRKSPPKPLPPRAPTDHSQHND